MASTPILVHDETAPDGRGSRSLSSVLAGAPAAGGYRGTTDALALRIADWLARRSEADQVYVFRAAARALRLPEDESLADAVEALGACQRDEGLPRVPSREQYRHWWDKQPKYAQWPSPWQLLKSFGGRWSNLRAALDGSPIGDVRSLTLTKLGGPRDNDSLIAAVTRWWSEAPDPEARFDLFRDWATERLAEGDLDISDVALSRNTYIDRFGSWAHTLERGHLERSLVRGLHAAHVRRQGLG